MAFLGITGASATRALCKVVSNLFIYIVCCEVFAKRLGYKAVHKHISNYSNQHEGI